MFSFISLAIRFSRLKKSSHDTSSPHPYKLLESMHYVHSPEIKELEPGKRVRKVAREGSLINTSHSSNTEKGREPAPESLALNPCISFPSSPHSVQCQLLPCLQHPAGASFPTFPDFPGKSWHLSSDVPGYFFV